ncbi:MAG: hypothetical protein QOE13_1400 [Gaiellaceae bacterium]|jgi:hypothetical protein|nr:hypothetical protein [Gaiellaceae bacterium]
MSSSMPSLGGIICLACGVELPESLRWTASLRCHGCRELQSPLRAELARWEQEFRLMRVRLEDLRAYPAEAPTAA